MGLPPFRGGLASGNNPAANVDKNGNNGNPAGNERLMSYMVRCAVGASGKGDAAVKEGFALAPTRRISRSAEKPLFFRRHDCAADTIPKY